jgi:hypothetical protein
MIRLARQWIWLGAVAVMILIAVFADVRAQPAAGEEALVSAAQKALGDALRSGDKSAVRKLLSLQFTFADETGKILARKEFLADLKGVAAAEPATDVKVGVYGLVAMVTGTRKSAQGNPVFFLDIWAKQKGSWRALTMQDVLLGTSDTQAAAAETPPGQTGRQTLRVQESLRNHPLPRPFAGRAGCRQYAAADREGGRRS